MNPDTLTFSTTNYGSDQTVTVTTTTDDDAFHDASALAHTPTIRGTGSPSTLLLPCMLREPAPDRRSATTPPDHHHAAAGRRQRNLRIDSQMVTRNQGGPGVPTG